MGSPGSSSRVVGCVSCGWRRQRKQEFISLGVKESYATFFPFVVVLLAWLKSCRTESKADSMVPIV